MAILKDIRKRIASVHNTQKVTNAMKMVSAAKLRKAQKRLLGARPYEAALTSVVREVVHNMNPAIHPLLRREAEPKTAEVFILTSDRGLCGGFNTNLLRKVEGFLSGEKESVKEIKLTMVGRKGRDFFRARRVDLEKVHLGLYDKIDFAGALNIASEIGKAYEAGEFDRFYLVYNSFMSSARSEIQIRQILPIITPEKEENELPIQVIYEPSREALLGTILPRWLAVRIYLAFLESVASECGARMIAMESATNNCRDMIVRLTMKLNRARQASITKELMDIVNGAEALRGS